MQDDDEAVIPVHVRDELNFLLRLPRWQTGWMVGKNSDPFDLGPILPENTDKLFVA